MTQTTLAAVIVGGTLVAWARFMLYLRARPEAAPQVESSLLSALASLDYLWPRGGGGLGSKITVGDAETMRSQLAQSRNPIFNADGFFWLMVFEGQPAAAAKIPAYVTANTAQSGFVALYRKCVHLGCSVPFCDTSKWFECPCHGSKYSINGEYRSGPAPRSLDRFRVDIVGGKIVVDTSQVITGPPRGTVTGQP